VTAACFEAYFSENQSRLMADSNHPNEESVHLDLPPEGAPQAPSANLKPRDTVRIQLPPRPPPPPPPVIPVVSPPRPTREPLPIVRSQDSIPSESKNQRARVEVMPELKKETARIPLVPEPPSKPLPTVQMKKTQPLIPMPEAAARNASISVALVEQSTTIPMALCWMLLGVSAIILIIQIWMYFS
jgi:hypothetical protein